MQNRDLRKAAVSIEDLRIAGWLFPFDHRFRTASALYLGNAALSTGHDDWKVAAAIEIMAALRQDPSAADLMLMLIRFDLELHRYDEAQAYFEQFKRVAKKSLLIPFVKSIHEQAVIPSPPK